MSSKCCHAWHRDYGNESSKWGIDEKGRDGRVVKREGEMETENGGALCFI